MEKIRDQFWRKLLEVVWGMKYPVITAALALLMKDSVWKTALLWVAVGMGIACGRPFVKRWWDRDTGERMFSDVQFAVRRMNVLLANQNDEQRRPYCDWWSGINPITSGFFTKPSRSEARIVACNIKMILSHLGKQLSAEETQSANAILDRIEPI